jgi:pyruvate carboxylase
MFPKVYDEYYHHKENYGVVTEIPTPAFFYPLETGQELRIQLRKGIVIHVKLIYVSGADEEGLRTVTFELNGTNRTIKIKDNSITSLKPIHEKATDPNKQIGAPLQGSLANVMVKEGDEVKSGTPLFVIEAMKMESTVSSPSAGKVKRVVLSANTMVDQNDMVIELE